ncbi:hypothetical protein UPYG_G00042010, partial [Umbra pygmaea]
TVYAPVSAPYIRQRKQSRSVASPFVKEICSLVCTVKNWNDTTLSTFRREKRLNQTSSPDLTTNLSLPLDVLSHDNDIYTCVAANPVSNQITELRIKEHCQSNAGPTVQPTIRNFILYGVLSSVCLMTLIGVIFWQCWNKRRLQHEEDLANRVDQGGENSMLLHYAEVEVHVNTPMSQLGGHDATEEEDTETVYTLIQKKK